MCECNASPFDKLRDSWSRYYKTETQGQCNCCCRGTNIKPKVKGKFGVAYIIETPTRKCRPVGWEVEFNDTPSQIENNCTKMMNWITCPPLGECQNNDTNTCCCTTTQKEMLNAMQQMCCKPANQNVCCCKEKNRNSEGDCCCKKPPQTCCCAKEKAQNQCCCRGNNQKQCCSKPKGKRRTMSGQQAYLNSKNNKCCCTIRSTNDNKCCCVTQKVEDYGCCCSKPAKAPKCCCQSDSESSLEDCCCQKGGRRKNKKECACKCNCSCEGSTKKETKNGDNKKTDSKQSKNVNSSEPTPEKTKGTPRSPYTISTSEAPKKGPDKEENKEDFHSELTKKLTELKKPEHEHKTKPDDEQKKKPDEKQKQKPEDEPHMEVEIKQTDYEKEKPHTEKPDQVKEEQRETKPNTESIIKPTKKVKRSDLLKKIRQEHRKEMEAIHPRLPNQEKILKEEQRETKPNTESIIKPIKKVKRSELLKKIRQEHRKEIEAIHPRLSNQEKVPKGGGEITEQNKSQDNKPLDKLQKRKRKFKRAKGEPTLLQKIKKKHKEEMAVIHPTGDNLKQLEDANLTLTDNVINPVKEEVKAENEIQARKEGVAENL